MRLLLCTLLYMFFTGCSRQKMHFLVPEAFQYPDDSIGEGKTFFYHDSVHNQNTYMQLRTYITGSDTIQSYFRYNDTAIIDSQIMSHGKLIETYRQLSTLNPRMYKGEDIVDITTGDGTKTGKNKRSYTYKNDTLKMEISSEYQFFKDTSILWKGVLLPCLAFQTVGHIELRSKKFAGLNHSTRVFFYGYYAPKLGEIKYTLAFKDRKNNDHYVQWNLISIENGVKPFARLSEQVHAAPR